MVICRTIYAASEKTGDKWSLGKKGDAAVTTHQVKLLDVDKKLHIVYIHTGTGVSFNADSKEYTSSTDPSMSMAKVLVPRSELTVLGAHKTYNTIRVGDEALVQKVYDEDEKPTGYYLLVGVINAV